MLRAGLIKHLMDIRGNLSAVLLAGVPEKGKHKSVGHLTPFLMTFS